MLTPPPPSPLQVHVSQVHRQRYIIEILCDCIVLCRISWIEVNGTTYKKGGVVVLEMDLVANFGVIQDVILYCDTMYFVCETIITDCFSNHFHAFKVYRQHPIEYSICKQAELYDHTVFDFLQTFITSLHSTEISTH